MLQRSSPLNNPHSRRSISEWSAIINVLISAALDARAESEATMIEIEQGWLNGTTSQTDRGRNVTSFRGVPYAKPPLGDLRFREPQPADKWESTLDATKDPEPCIQWDFTSKDVGATIGNEDCLKLIIHVPEAILQQCKSDPINCEKIPVLVFFHGGSWVVGSGATGPLGPLHLLNNDVILVTVNFRLYALGFLCTGDAASPGNYGLKDMVMALEWVQENIGYFGGNNRSVTISGQSSGAASVHYLALSPLSRGLFHHVISFSGNALGFWALQRNPGLTAAKLANLLGCPSDRGTTEMVNCLRTKPADQINNKFPLMAEWTVDPFILFGPCIESSPGPEKPFLPKHPYQILASGEFHKIKFMCGITKDDGAFRSSGVLASDQSTKELNDNFTTGVGAITLRLKESAIDPSDACSKIKKFYFGDDDISTANYQNLTQLYGDRFFFVDLILALKTMLAHPTKLHAGYMYKFAYRGKYSFLDGTRVIDKSTGENVDFGVSHSDDLMYLFPEKPVVVSGLQGKDAEISQLWCELIYNFVKFGNPTPHITDSIATKWEPVTTSSIQYMQIGGDDPKLRMKALSEEERGRCEFWEGLELKENARYDGSY